MNLYARVRNNPHILTRSEYEYLNSFFDRADDSQLSDEVVKVGKQVVTILSTPVPTDDAAGLLFYAAVVHETKKKVLALIIKAEQLQAENQKALTCFRQ